MRIILLISLLIASAVAFAAEKTTEVFTLDHQMSQHCEKKIKENLRFEKGISKIEVSLPANTIAITYDVKKTNTEKIIEAFKKIGFNAFLCNPDQPEVCPEECCEPTPCAEEPQEQTAPGCCGGCR